MVAFWFLLGNEFLALYPEFSADAGAGEACWRICSPQACGCSISINQPNRWWTGAREPSADAADVSKLPTPDDLKKRRPEAKEQARVAGQSAKGEPRKTPPNALGIWN
jgi:hypothetical protein